MKVSANKLNTDLRKTNNAAFQWKMSFSLETNKQDQEVIFNRILDRSAYLPLGFNYVNVTKSESQKYLGIKIDSNLDKKDHWFLM